MQIIRRRQQRRGERSGPEALRYSPRWLAALLLGGGLWLAGLWRGGFARTASLGALLGAGLLGGYARFVEPRRPRLVRRTLRLAGLPLGLRGLRIGLLGDFHLGWPYNRENLIWAVSQMRAEQPDLILISGDAVSFVPPISELPALLAPLQAPLGGFFVPGNHDHWEGVAAVSDAVAAAGITVLTNRGRRLVYRGTPFGLAGVDDMWSGEPDLAAALAEIGPPLPTILLAHAPDFADLAAAHGLMLQLSGHSHGGQIRLPLLGPLSLPPCGQRYPLGEYHVGPTRLYVSCGLGGAPLRLGCPPEATIITLEML